MYLGVENFDDHHQGLIFVDTHQDHHADLYVAFCSSFLAVLDALASETSTYYTIAIFFLFDAISGPSSTHTTF